MKDRIVQIMTDNSGNIYGLSDSGMLYVKIATYPEPDRIKTFVWQAHLDSPEAKLV